MILDSSKWTCAKPMNPNQHAWPMLQHAPPELVYASHDFIMDRFRGGLSPW